MKTDHSPHLFCLRFLAAAWVVCAVVKVTNAAELYVSTEGNDGGAGTLAQPYKTIQRAMNAAGAGDTVNVRGGIYKERVSLTGKNGSSANRIILQAHTGEEAVLDLSGVTPANGASALLRLHNCSHITVRNLVFRNYKTSSSSQVPIGILVSGSGTGVEIVGNRIHSIWQSNTQLYNSNANAHGLLVSGSSNSAPISAILIEGNELSDLRLGASEALVINGNVDGFVVRRNVVRDCNNLGIDFIGGEGTVGNASLDKARNGLCAENLVYNIDTQFNPAYGGDFGAGGGNDTRGAAGIYVDAAENIIIERNHVHHCNFGIEVGNEHAGRVTTGITVRNNLLRHNHVGGIFMGSYDTSMGGISNCSFTHNTLYQNDTEAYGGGQVAIQNHVNSVMIQHNIMVCANRSYKPFILNTSTLGSISTGSINFNLYSGAPTNSLEFIWRNVSAGSFASWRNLSGQDANSLFVSSVGFTDAAGSDFSLLAGSMAIDSGSPGFVAASTEADFLGRSRVASNRVDIGAYEFGATPAAGPEVTTLGAQDVLHDSAVLTGAVVPGATDAQVAFQWGTSPGLQQGTTSVNLSAGGSRATVNHVLSGLQADTTYYFRIIGTNLTGTNVGILFSFRTRTAEPQFDQGPASLLLREGENASFTAVPVGGLPMTYRWRKNGVAIKGGLAASTTLNLQGVAGSAAGLYSLSATNAIGTTVSPAAVLAVVRAATSSQTVNESSTMSLDAGASAPPGVLAFHWLKDGVPLVDGGRITGTTSARLVVRGAAAADSGDYQCLVQMGEQSRLSATQTVTVRLRPVMNSYLPSTSWMVGGLVGDVLTASSGPTSFKATGLPPGLKLDTVTGALTGRPTAAGDYVAFITASNEAGAGPPMLIIVHVEPLPVAVVGSFSGIVARSALHGQQSLGGSIQFTISATGYASGSVVFGTVKKSFAKQIETALGQSPTLNVPVSLGAGKPTLTLALTINRQTGVVTGTMVDGANLLLPAVAVNAVRAAWNSRTAPAGGLDGNYTLLLRPGTPVLGNEDYPQGTGYASVKVSRAGVAQLTGFLADGSPLNFSAALDAQGSFPVFALSQSNLGSVLGWVTIDRLSAGTPISGELSWFRNSTSSAGWRNYAAGIPEHTLSVLGSRWVKPLGSVGILGLGPLPTQALIKLDSPTPALQQTFTLQENHVPSVPVNAFSVTLALNTSTGLYSGGFVLRDPPPGGIGPEVVRSVKYSGAVLSLQHEAAGYFLLPGLPVPTADPEITLKNSPLTSRRSGLETF